MLLYLENFLTIRITLLIFRLSSMLFLSYPSTLLNTLDCAGNHAHSSHFTGAIVSKALGVSSALRDHLIFGVARNETRCGIQSVSLSNTFETQF